MDLCRSALVDSMKTPRKLRLGDTVGIVSTSSPTTPEAIDNLKKYFEKKGFFVKIAPHVLARFGFMAGTNRQRAEDFNLMIRDPEVRMIVTSMGGSGAVHLLSLIDYKAISCDPKIVTGLSNPAIILNAISCVSNVPTFHGPNGVEFGFGPLTRFSEENFWLMVSGNLSIPHDFQVTNGMKILREGKVAEGRLYGGHLRTIQPLIGTPYEPDWRDSILFIEEINDDLCRIDAMLAHFRLAGVFGSIKGLIVGRQAEPYEVEAETLEDIVLRNCEGYDFPIVTDVPIGHTDDKLTVPIGCLVRLNTDKPSFELSESPTC
jgi:muramoyltetrapeptide carboxypeptidase